MIRKRCAIYTRKSTDEGLDQSFNSLDAQREACEAFVVSQRHEGWVLVKSAYDDSGFSGGSMERPALQRLLADIRSGLVDIVVVYKIDRLTRSLADFAKMVEVFDAGSVSFVSVTQQFNTTTSMGRLTLNVLLSFAQFEREVTAERIRDKIAASKKKGMWMGGPPPLGYDIRDKKLVINPQEAEQVRKLFEAYLELGSTKYLTQWARDNGITTKIRRRADGSIRAGGKPFSRGNLHALLRYRTYLGEVEHRGNVYDGDHEPIIERKLWNRVEAELTSQRQYRGRTAGRAASRPLAGLVFDETGDRLTPVHANKSGRRYDYYVSTRLIETDATDTSGWRLSAPVLEHAVFDGVFTLLKDDGKLQMLLHEYKADRMLQVHVLARTLSGARQLADEIQQHDWTDGLRTILPAIDRIDLQANQMTIQINIRALLIMIGCTKVAAEPHSDIAAVHPISVPFAVKRRGVETRLIIGNGKEPTTSIDQVLVRTVARARTWFGDLKSGAMASIKDIAVRDGIPASEVSRELPLAFLAPLIVSAILAGRQPVELTAKKLKRLTDLPLDWNEQSRFLGFIGI